jgi:hypothetical protein
MRQGEGAFFRLFVLIVSLAETDSRPSFLYSVLLVMLSVRLLPTSPTPMMPKTRRRRRPSCLLRHHQFVSAPFPPFISDRFSHTALRCPRRPRRTHLARPSSRFLPFPLRPNPALRRHGRRRPSPASHRRDSGSKFQGGGSGRWKCGEGEVRFFVSSPPFPVLTILSLTALHESHFVRSPRRYQRTSTPHFEPKPLSKRRNRRKKTGSMRKPKRCVSPPFFASFPLAESLAFAVHYRP